MRFLNCLLIALFFTACTPKPTTASFGDIDTASIAKDTLMQRRFESSYEYQQQFAAGENRYELKSTAYMKEDKRVTKCLVVYVTATKSDTIFEASAPSSIYYSRLIDADADGMVNEILAIAKLDTIKNTAYIFSAELPKHVAISFPLPKEKGYRGRDTFFVEKNEIIHHFQIYHPDSLAGSSMKYHYKMKHGKLVALRSETV